MQLVDANVLIYAVNADTPHHRRARSWLDASLVGDEPIGFAWAVLLAFLRLTTRPALFRRPLTVSEATGVIEAWLAEPMAVIVQPSDRHLALLTGLLVESGTAANLVGDAHLAVLALEHGAEIRTFDADFGRFAGVRWRPPGD